MRVTSGNSNPVATAPKKLSAEEIQAKIAAKFGREAEIKKAPPKPKTQDNANISKQETVAHGDIGNNDPNSDVTREKLKGLLKSGGFKFNDKERKALAQILK